MSLTYYKRFRMEIPLLGRDFDRALPLGYRLIPWRDDLIEAHADVKYQCFQKEIDAEVFPCLGEFPGCLKLMTEISRKPGFLSEATWLLANVSQTGHVIEYCGTVQGIRDRTGFGAIQNLGVTFDHRHLGLGTTLLFRALEGFRRVGLQRVYLEVTAQNDRAVMLYKRLGFVKAKTLYKVVQKPVVALVT